MIGGMEHEELVTQNLEIIGTGEIIDFISFYEYLCSSS